MMFSIGYWEKQEKPTVLKVEGYCNNCSAFSINLKKTGNLFFCNSCRRKAFQKELKKND